MKVSFWSIVLAAALFLAGPGVLSHASAQGLTGQISGVVADSSGGVLPGVTVVLKNTGTGATREAVTGADGRFVFPDLLAGTYDVTASLSGFKTNTQKSIVLSSTDRVVVRPITLEVGQLTEEVSVVAEVTLVQVQTAARSSVVTQEQIQDISLKGRDFLGALKMLPGVVDTSNREAPGWGSGGVTINGRGSYNLMYDGVTNKDTGSNSNQYAAPGLDSIAEIKVQTSNYQAEFGRSSGGLINVVTKSGSKNFRGSLGYYRRNEAYNANDWSRRRQCDSAPILNGLPNPNCAKPTYRYDNTAWTLGGPIYVPGKFNKDKSKLFFFFSEDLLPRTDPGTLRQVTVPTALERSGDFSQTFDTRGRLINIRDPQLSGTCDVVNGGPACFSGNKIPAERINKIGQTLLNLMPLPNDVDPSNTRQYNYTFQSVQRWPRDDQILRIDWNVAPKTTFYSRLQWGFEERSGGVSFLGTNQDWPQYPSSYGIPTRGIVNTLLHTFSSSMVLEVTVGGNTSKQITAPIDQAAQDANDTARVLPGWRQFFPDANPLHVLPQVSMAGTNALPNTGGFGVESRFPFTAENNTWDFTANLTRLAGAHNLKFGAFYEYNQRPASRSSNFNGSLSFNPTTANPYDTNFGFANALLGSVNSYTESDGHPRANGRYKQAEFYAQDNWRLKRNFTLDLGVRAYYIGPTYVAGQKVAMFDPAKFDPKKAPLLYQPVCPNNAATCASTARLALNPLTGQTSSAVYIGRLVPNSGDPYNGMQVFDGTVLNGSPLLAAPRVGFAWDVTGDGKTAIRGGAGTFYDRYSDDNILSLVEQPPLLNTYTVNNTTVPELLATPLTLTPRGVSYLAPFRAPIVFNYSLGVQRDIGWKIVADVAYVGNVGRRQRQTYEINGVSYGVTRLPQNLDPTNTVSGQIVNSKANDFLRPYQGYGGISQAVWTGYDKFNSVQVTINRRASHGLSFGVSYTGSVRWNLGSRDPFLTDAENKARNYNKSGSRPHYLVVNYSYEIPSLAKHAWNNTVGHAIFDGWQLSGITTYQGGTYGTVGTAFSGVPNTVSPTITNGAIGGTGSRINFLCDPNLPRSEWTFARTFRTECVAPPGGPGDPYFFGTSRGDELKGMGFLNHDISLFRNVALPGRNRTLQFRIELYNAFNTTEYTGRNTNAQFDYASYLNYLATGDAKTLVQTNAALGQITSAQQGRRIQLGARFTF